MREGKENKPDLVFTQNIRSTSVPGWTKDFLDNEAYRKSTRTDQIYLTHEILSFSSFEDPKKITPEIIKDITKEYMRLRGHEGVMVGAVHWDKNVHVHLAVSALKYRAGTSFRLSKPKLRELKVSLQEYHRQKYPEISMSFPNHGKGKAYLNNRQWYTEHKNQRNLLKEQITGKVQSCFKHAASRKEFLELLREENLHFYERNGVPTGIEMDDLKFRFSGMIEKEQFHALPDDLKEEEKALAEIRSIRKERAERDRHSDRSLER